MDSDGGVTVQDTQAVYTSVGSRGIPPSPDCLRWLQNQNLGSVTEIIMEMMVVLMVVLAALGNVQVTNIRMFEPLLGFPSVATCSRGNCFCFPSCKWGIFVQNIVDISIHSDLMIPNP